MPFRKGQIFKTLRPIPVTSMTEWAAPCTLGDKRVLPANEEFKIDIDPPETATAVVAAPLNYKQLHKAFVSWKDRWHPLYRGYYLCISMKSVESDCTLIKDSET